ncbi:MAG: DUF4136 domain-containing protein [Microbacteriaceae bacterium]|nr:DUF4136 domain-containing protein [Burkholderiaceae bacterium]
MKTLIATLFMLLLSGCAGVRLVDTQVQAVSTLAPGSTALTGAHYRFERLPLQTAQPGFDRTEALAQAALARVGLVRDEAGATVSVQLSVRAGSYLVDSSGRPYSGPGWTGGAGGYGQLMIGSSGMFGIGMRSMPSTLYRHEVNLVLRDVRSSQVLYETRAVNEGPWSDADQVLAAVFEAALRDFPNPPAGPHLINIEIPR